MFRSVVQDVGNVRRSRTVVPSGLRRTSIPSIVRSMIAKLCDLLSSGR